MKPVAVLLSTFNGSQWVEEFLTSLESQIGVDLYLFHRDDGSTDDTVSILTNFDFRKVKVISSNSHEHLGVTHSYLKLLKQAEGFKYYAFADQDDIWMPRKTYMQISKIESIDTKPALNLIGFSIGFSKDSAFRMEPSILKTKQYLVGNHSPGCTMVFNDALREIILQGDPNNLVMHDSWAILIASLFGRIILESTPGVIYRQHDSNDTGFSTKIQDRFNNLQQRLANLPVWKMQLEQVFLITTSHSNSGQRDVEVMKDLLSLDLRHRLLKFMDFPQHPGGKTITALRRFVFLFGCYSKQLNS